LVVEKEEGSVTVRVRESFKLKKVRKLHLIGKELPYPTISEKDKKDIVDFGVKNCTLNFHINQQPWI